MAYIGLGTTLPIDRNAQPVQVMVGTGTRVVVTASGTALAATALPDTGVAKAFYVRCTDYIWLVFGDNSVAATSDADSILCPPGEGVYVQLAQPTHFSVLRVGASDVTVQIESIH